MQATPYNHHFLPNSGSVLPLSERTRRHRPMETWYQEASLESAWLEYSYSCFMMPFRLLIELY
jgi:hypothetical protein